MGASLREPLKKERTWTVAQGTHNLLQRTGPNSRGTKGEQCLPGCFPAEPGPPAPSLQRSRTSGGSLSTQKAVDGSYGALAPKGALLDVCK